MTEKSCDHHDDNNRRFHIQILTAVGSTLILTVLIVFLILQPQTPKFTLNDVTIYAFNASPPNLLTANLQVTVASRNPNGRIGVLYDRLHVSAAYRDEQFTLAAALPATYQGHGGAAVWSPILYGNSVPVSPELAAALREDRSAGMVLLSVKIKGRVRWKVGTWISGRYDVFVTCPAYIWFGKLAGGIAVGQDLKFQLVQSCTVDVSTG